MKPSQGLARHDRMASRSARASTQGSVPTRRVWVQCVAVRGHVLARQQALSSLLALLAGGFSFSAGPPVHSRVDAGRREKAGEDADRQAAGQRPRSLLGPSVRKDVDLSGRIWNWQRVPASQSTHSTEQRYGDAVRDPVLVVTVKEHSLLLVRDAHPRHQGASQIRPRPEPCDLQRANVSGPVRWSLVHLATPALPLRDLGCPAMAQVAASSAPCRV